jgi:hypothetical protein
MLRDNPFVRPAASLVLAAAGGTHDLYRVAGLDLGFSPRVSRQDFAVDCHGDLPSVYVKGV